jgi:hypothetical protein
MPATPPPFRRSGTRRATCGAVLIAAAAVLAAGCGGGDGGGTRATIGPAIGAPSSTDAGGPSDGSGRGDACSPAVDEPLDPNLTHLVVGAPEPTYLTDPPTSGPHVVGRVPTGVLDRPLRRPEQVALLEEGHVLVQHHDLPVEDVDALGALAGRHAQVTVAPNASLPDRLVATAWTVKQVCRAVDVDALERFVTAHVGRGPGDG